MTEEQLQKRREANAARMRAWREANPELAKERMRAFEAKNREKRIAYKAELRAEKAEHYRAYWRERGAKYRAEHPEEWAAYIKAYRESPEQREKAKAYWKRSGQKKQAQRKAAREALPPPVYSDDLKKIKAREYMREWTKKNYERVREQKNIVENNRRAKKKAGGHFTRAEWRAVCAQQNGLCFDCGERRRLTVGHLVPLSKGGLNVIANIVAQCMPCNLKQHGDIHHTVSG
jgi:5-methylcytosine-specific restriction endonuclease McrA